MSVSSRHSPEVAFFDQGGLFLLEVRVPCSGGWGEDALQCLLSPAAGFLAHDDGGGSFDTVSTAQA